MNSIPLAIINPYADSRPDDVAIDTIVIHSMFAEGQKNQFDCDSCHLTLIQHQVSAHYYIGQDGQVFASVPEKLRAWHAGKSKMPFPDDQREVINDFSIGIELLGDSAIGFSEAQYLSLILLIQNISRLHPISAIVGHDQIAPGRKTDPGDLFDWNRLKTEFKKQYRFN